MKNFEKLFGYSYQDINQLLVKIGTNLLIAIIIFFVGFWLAKMASKAIRKVLVKSKTDESLISFLASLTNISIKALVVITGINQLGIEMTSFVAILGAAGLAIGMAFSGTLSNFAGGVMILAFKPFKVGDTIKTLGETGKVKEIQIFNTYLNTSDNKVIILPNGPVANGHITNFTRENRRGVDAIFRLNNGTDLDVVKEIILAYIKSDKKILAEPKPIIGVTSVTHESIDISVMIWGKTADNTNILHDLNEFVYRKFQGLDINDSHKKMHPLNSNILIQQYNETNNFGEFLGISFTILEKGKVHYFAKIERNLLATPKAVHGGLIATLCDGALGIAALSTVVEDNKVVATIEMNIKYLKPAFEGEEIVAKAIVISAGKRIIVSTCEVFNQNQELIAIASGTFNAYPKEKAGY